jgi:hypothetical protein
MLLRVKMGYKSMHPDVEGAGGASVGRVFRRTITYSV